MKEILHNKPYTEDLTEHGTDLDGTPFSGDYPPIEAQDVPVVNAHPVSKRFKTPAGFTMFKRILESHPERRLRGIKAIPFIHGHHGFGVLIGTARAIGAGFTLYESSKASIALSRKIRDRNKSSNP